MLPPLQLQYDPPIDTSYTDVVTNRLRTVINHPKAKFSPGERIAFVLNTTSFVDLRSVKLHARIEHIYTNSDKTYNTYYTPYLFENIILKTTGGTIIEQIEHAQTVAHLRDLLSRRVVDNETQSTSNFNTTGPYFDERNIQQYYPSENSNAYHISISAYDILGFFNMNKVMRMSTMGGLIIEFLLAQPEMVVQFRGDRDRSTNYLLPRTFSYELNNVMTVYDEVEVTDAFLSNYTAKYERKGFTLEFMSVTNTRDFITGLNGKKVIPINRSLQRCKYIISVARPATLIMEPGHKVTNELNAPQTVMISSYNNFLAPASDSFSFQYKLSGELLPRREASNFLMAYNELEKVVQSDVTRRQRNNLSYENYSNNLRLKRPLDSEYKTSSHFRINSTNVGTIAVVTDISTHPCSSVDLSLPNIGTWHTFNTDDIEHRSFYVKTSQGGIFRAMIIKNDDTASSQGPLVYLDEDTNITTTPPYILRVFMDFKIPNNFFHVQTFATPTCSIPLNQNLDKNRGTTVASQTQVTASLRLVYPDKERFAHQGSFMMAISLNSVDTITSSNTKPVDSSSAYLEFDFKSTYNETNHLGDAGYRFSTACVDTFLYHFTTLRVSDGQVEVSR